MAKTHNKKLLLTIACFSIIAILLLTNKITTKNSVEQHAQDLSSIYNNMMYIFSDEPISGNMSQFIEIGVFPSTMEVVATSVKNVDGGTVEITPNHSGSGYNVSYQKIKTDDCVDLLTTQRNVGWSKYIVLIGDSFADASSGSNFAGSTITNLTDSCNLNGSMVSIGFYME